jgi:hypothetical protein
MTLFLIWLAMLGALWVAEHGAARFPFAVAALVYLAAAALLIVGDPLRATLLAAIMAVVIAGFSAVKHHHSGTRLTVADLWLTFSGSIPFILRQYRRTSAITIAAAAALALAVIATLSLAAGPPVRLDLRVGLLAVATALYLLLYRASGGAGAFRPTVTERAHVFSGFMASLIDVSSWWRSAGLRLGDIARDPLPLSARIPGRASHQPDILVVQHESLFDPRIFGLPVEPEIERFLSPPAGRSGRLHVEIYGGGSWQTEFSMLTGLSSRSFGPDSYFLFRKGAGRFHHSLPRSLSGLGYRAMLAAACRRQFMGYDAFYDSIGVDERLFSEDFPPPFDLARFEDTSSDAMFLQAAGRAFAERLARDSMPVFLLALTNFNHGPHDRRRVPPGSFETARAFAHASLPDAHYAEYYARLAETVASWTALRTSLAARFPDRPMLVVHYGDHQPVMTRRIEAALGIAEDDRRQFTTFFAIEGINLQPASIGDLPDAGLDVAFLGTVALRAAGLPLDPIFATRASLLADCGEDYFASTSERKRRFHRSLVDMGLIETGPPQDGVLAPELAQQKVRRSPPPAG